MQLPREDLPDEWLPVGLLHLYERRLSGYTVLVYVRQLGR